MRGDRGFTIIELMAATFISVLFAGAFFAAFYAMRNEVYQENVFFSTGRATRHTLDIASRDIKEAIRAVPTRGGDTTGNEVLILELPSIDASGIPTNIASQFDYVVYKKNSSDTTQLIRSLDILNGVSLRNGGADAPNKVVARNLQTILFSSNGVNLSSVGDVSTLKSINLQILSSGRTLKATQSTQLDSDVMLRNK